MIFVFDVVNSWVKVRFYFSVVSAVSAANFWAKVRLRDICIWRSKFLGKCEVNVKVNIGQAKCCKLLWNSVIAIGSNRPPFWN